MKRSKLEDASGISLFIDELDWLIEAPDEWEAHVKIGTNRTVQLASWPRLREFLKGEREEALRRLASLGIEIDDEPLPSEAPPMGN